MTERIGLWARFNVFVLAFVGAAHNCFFKIAMGALFAYDPSTQQVHSIHGTITC